MEVAPPPQGLGAVQGGTTVVFEYRDALTGSSLGRREVSRLSPTLRVDGRVVAPMAPLEDIPDLGIVRGDYALAPRTDVSFGVAGSSRYFGCSADVPIDGAAPQRVVISLVPRAREISVRVRVRAGEGERVTELPPEGLAEVDLRADAATEGDVEVHLGRCSGEPPPRGQSVWCVRFVRAEPTPMDLAVRAPGYGITRVRLDPTDSSRTLAVNADYQGNIVPTTTIRAAVGIGLTNSSSPGYLAAVDTAAPSRLYGTSCPVDDTCIRPVVHVGVGFLPYTRDTSLLGPGSRVTPDGSTSGDLTTLEVGGGVSLVLPGAGGRFRATALLSGLVAGRSEERDAAHGNLLLSPATSLLGGVAEVLAGVRIFDGLVLNAGARVTYVPTVGSQGREFSFLGDASAAVTTGALTLVTLVLGASLEL